MDLLVSFLTTLLLGWERRPSQKGVGTNHSRHRVGEVGNWGGRAKQAGPSPYGALGASSAPSSHYNGQSSFYNHLVFIYMPPALHTEESFQDLKNKRVPRKATSDPRMLLNSGDLEGNVHLND